MSSLLDAGLIEVNPRGHYRVPLTARSACAFQVPDETSLSASSKTQAKVVGEDYFPASNGPLIVEGDYFPTE